MMFVENLLKLISTMQNTAFLRKKVIIRLDDKPWFDAGLRKCKIRDRFKKEVWLSL